MQHRHHFRFDKKRCHLQATVMTSSAVVRAGIGAAVITEAKRGQNLNQVMTKFKVICVIKVLYLD